MLRNSFSQPCFAISTLLLASGLFIGTADAKSVLDDFGFGIGLSLTIDTGSDERVESASVDADGIVRVDEEEDAIARVILETHFFADCDDVGVDTIPLIRHLVTRPVNVGSDLSSPFNLARMTLSTPSASA